MKKSFLWAFSLVICLVACLTACDNDSVVDESATDSSVSTQIPALKSGTVDLFNSVGNKIGTAPYELTYLYQDSTSHSTRSSNLENNVWNFCRYNVHLFFYYNIHISGISGGIPKVYSGYGETNSSIAVLRGTINNLSFVIKPKNERVFFTMYVFPFYTDFVVTNNKGMRLYKIHIRTDNHQWDAAQTIRDELLPGSLRGMATKPEAIKNFLVVYFYDKKGNLVDSSEY